jgi:hypothetical protein
MEMKRVVAIVRGQAFFGAGCPSWQPAGWIDTPIYGCRDIRGTKQVLTYYLGELNWLPQPQTGMEMRAGGVGFTLQLADLPETGIMNQR